MDFSDDLLSFSTRLVFSTNGLTNDVKVYWGKILFYFYSTRYSRQQVRQKEVQFAVQKFKNKEEWVKEFESLTKEDKILTIVLLKLLLKKAEVFNQPIALDSLTAAIALLTETGAQEIQAIERKYHECSINLGRHENRKKIIVPASILPLAADYTIKWIILIICRFNSSDRLVGITFMETFFFIVVFIFLNYRDQKHNRRLFQKHKAVEDYKIDFQFSAQKYTWLAFFFTTSLIISNFMDVKDEGGTITDYIIGGLIFGLYYFIGLRFFPSGRVSEVSLLRQIRSQKNLIETLDSDKNDEAIVNIETEINSKTGRLDAYVLESALFGALAFSGFLQVISTDFVSFKELDLFSKLVFDATQNLVMMDHNALASVLSKLNTKSNLFCLAAIETLLCSGFFIAVIASRLRFSNVADRVNKGLDIAKSYVMKSELLIEKDTTHFVHHSEKLTHFNSKVSEQIILSQEALEEINPITGYMEYFRNAGLLMFLLVLISCGLFVTSFLGWLYVGIGIATWIYFNKVFIISKGREVILTLQLSFISRSYIYLVLSVIIILSGFLLRITLGLQNTNFLIILGFFGIGLFMFLSFLIAPHYDDIFGAIEESTNINYLGKWNLIQAVYGFLILASVTSLGLFAYIDYSDASGWFGASLAFMFLLNLSIGYYCAKKRWLGILISAILLFYGVTVFLGLSPEIFGRRAIPYLVGLGIALSCYIVTKIWSRLFHRLFRHILAFYIILIFILGCPLFYGALTEKIVFSIPNTVTTLYQHKTYKFDSLSYWINLRLPKGLSKDDKLNFYLKRSRSYRHHFNDVNGFTFAYDWYASEMVRTADSLFKKGKETGDSVNLKKALEFAIEQKEIHRLFKFKNLEKSVDLECNILMELKKRPEAINTLKEIINSEADESLKKKAKEKLKEIEEEKPKKKSS